MSKTWKDVFREILEYLWERILEKLCDVLCVQCDKEFYFDPFIYLQIYTVF